MNNLIIDCSAGMKIYIDKNWREDGRIKLER